MIRIDDNSFMRIVDYMKQFYGLDLTKKRVLVECRLTKVLQNLKIDNFEDYVKVLEKDQSGVLLEQMVDILTTHYTYFLRENEHFQMLKDFLLPEFVQNKKSTTFQVWCAGCSTGEEAYCIAMTIEDYKKQSGNQIEYMIYATDISDNVLSVAQKGEYPLKQISTIDFYWQYQYCQNIDATSFQIRDDIRRHIIFDKHNLMQPLRCERRFDLILCRNVMIYFHKDIRYQIVESLENHLYNDGYLMIGHAEMLSNTETTMERVYPSIYKKSGEMKK